ncbi:hypothetical protein GWI33_007481 [Rhynchophorus ferrugineus]|uniref:Uncharacterized protein n=1 Tax=Rhynchophorus ferrugineus TaxID=354439 RepID=A0A834MGN7_RHYFE|nr:hypothetical protein GWI33_007481 [Rhynchophorus ferrugineus]
MDGAMFDYTSFPRRRKSRTGLGLANLEDRERQNQTNQAKEQFVHKLTGFKGRKDEIGDSRDGRTPAIAPSPRIRPPRRHGTIGGPLIVHPYSCNGARSSPRPADDVGRELSDLYPARACSISVAAPTAPSAEPRSFGRTRQENEL